MGVASVVAWADLGWHAGVLDEDRRMTIIARTVEVTYLMPRPIASSIARAHRSTRPARQIELMALPEQTIVPREYARSTVIYKGRTVGRSEPT
jgi:hypothetical protein